MNYRLKVFVASIAAVFICFQSAAAGSIEVNSPGSYETRKLNLKADQKADLTVYINSAGEMLDGFRVILVRDADRKLLGMLQSDIYGVVTFENIPEGKYTIVLKKTRRERRLSSVGITDWRLVKHGKGKEEAEVTELQTEKDDD